MRRKDWGVVCGLTLAGMVLAGGARSAIEDPATAQVQAQAAHDQAVLDDYVGRFQSAYDDAGGPAQSDAKTPPIDIIALSHAITAFKTANAACAARAADKTSTRVQCWQAAVKDFTHAAQLRDPQLPDALSATLTRLAADADAGFVSGPQANKIYPALLDMFNTISFATLERYLAGTLKTPDGDNPPFDMAALAAADEAAKNARDACNGDGTQTNAVYVDCLLAADAGLNTAIKITDTAQTDTIAAILKQGAAAADADKLSRDELHNAYAILQILYRGALDERYNAWLGQRYARQFDRLYADAKAQKPKEDNSGPLIDMAAVPGAQAARQTAYTQCGTLALGKTATAVMQCYLDADKAYLAATKMRDGDLADTFSRTVLAAAADADAGKLTTAQVAAVWQALADDYDAKFSQEDGDVQAKINKPIIDAYVARFERAADANPPADANNAPLFDANAVAAAKTAQTEARNQCEARDAELKTAAARMQCYTDAFQAFETAIKAQDMYLVTADIATNMAAARDADAGKLTPAQLDAVSTAVDATFNAKARAAELAYTNRLNKPVSDTYVARFDKEYAAARLKRGELADDVPPYDTTASKAANAEGNKADAQCGSNVDQFKTQTDRVQCYLDAALAGAATSKVRDMALYDAFVAAARAAAADADAGKITPSQLASAYGAILTDLSGRLAREYADYRSRINQPVIDAYVARFDTALAAARTAHGNLSPDTPPNDPALAAAAVTARNQADASCNARREALKTETSLAQCRADAMRNFTTQQKFADKDLLDTFLASAAAAAADADAGKMTADQFDAVYNALGVRVNSVFDPENSAYRVRINKPIADAWSQRFDKEYVQAGGERSLGNDAPYDPGQIAGAQADLTRAYSACAARHLKTETDARRCYLDAFKIYDLAIKLRDMALFDAVSAAEIALAADRDAGKVTAEQFSAAFTAIDGNYANRLNGEYAAYRARVITPLANAYRARFDADYAAASAAHAQVANDAPPYDPSLLTVAQVDSAKATAQCNAQRAQAKTQLAAENCFLAVHLAYAAAIREQDKVLLDTYIAAQRAVAADADAGKLDIGVTGEIYTAIANDERDKLNAEEHAYELKAYKPLADAYVARFDAAYAAAGQGRDTTASRPYDTTRNSQARLNLTNTQDRCRTGRAQFANQLALENCLLDAYRAYATAIAVQDEPLLDTFLAAQRAVAADTDAGKITLTQESAISTSLDADEGARLNKEYVDWQAKTLKPIADSWSQRFDAEYARLEVARTPDPKTPPYDGYAVPSATAVRSKALASCNSRQTELKTALAIRNCSLDAITAYHTAIKWQDTPLDTALFDVERAATADADAGRLTPEELTAILTAVGGDYDKRADKIGSDYADSYNRSSIANWTQSYDLEYLKRSAGKSAADGPPYDAGLAAKAAADRNQAYNLCAAQQALLKTNAALQNCYLAAAKNFAVAIKLQDMALYDAYDLTIRRAAAAADGGRIIQYFYAQILSAVAADYDGRRQKQYDVWLLKAQKPIVDAWLKQFEQAYQAAGPTAAGDDAPYDSAAMAQATEDRAQAYRLCVAQHETSKTLTAFVQCTMDANKPYIVAIKLKDTRLFNSFAATELAIAADRDAGKLTAEQYSAANQAVDSTYQNRLARTYLDWQIRQNKPVVDTYLARFDKEYADASAKHGPLAANMPPYDAAAVEEGVTTRNAALQVCNAKRTPATERNYLDCYVEANRAYAVQTRLLDMALFDAFTAATTSAIEDDIAGKLSRDQVRIVTAAIFNEMGTRVGKENQAYQAARKTAAAAP